MAIIVVGVWSSILFILMAAILGLLSGWNILYSLSDIPILGFIVTALFAIVGLALAELLRSVIAIKTVIFTMICISALVYIFRLIFENKIKEEGFFLAILVVITIGIAGYAYYPSYDTLSSWAFMIEIPTVNQGDGVTNGTPNSIRVPLLCMLAVGGFFSSILCPGYAVYGLGKIFQRFLSK